MAKKQYFGIRYPFLAESEENYFIDLNNTLKDKVRGQILHVIFTPKGQKIRDPEFGTDLIRYIFDMNDETLWGGIKNEISESVKRYVNNVTLNDINIIQNDNDRHEIFVRVDYSVTEGNLTTTDAIITKI